MQRLIEFTGNHPYLVSAAVLMLVLVIVWPQLVLFLPSLISPEFLN